MAIRAALILSLAVPIAACGIPRDPEGTTGRHRAGQPLLAATTISTNEAAPAIAVIGDVARTGGTVARWQRGEAELLLHALEQGRLDAVAGHFAAASPWHTRVDLSRAINRPEPDDRHRPVLRIARRNGENAFIRRIDRRIRP